MALARRPLQSRPMRFPEPPLEGRLLSRYKRFFADVELADGSLLTAHCPNTGSMLGCKDPGSPVWLRDSKNDKRKLRFTWQAVRTGRTWINLDTGLPNRVVFEALEGGRVAGLTGYTSARREVRYGENSRIDVLLESPELPPCYVEVKNTTYAVGDAAMFPDAVTERGRKHLHEMTRMVRQGARAVQFYFVSRGDVTHFRPAQAIDPEYSDALAEAVAAGVEVLAYSTRVTPRTLELAQSLPVHLAEPRVAVAVAVASTRRKKA